MTETPQVAGLRASSRALCTGYALTFALALVATWSQNLARGDRHLGRLDV